MIKKRIYLIGYRGSGKTSVGKELAKKLAYKHFDFDEEIEKDKGMSIFKSITLYGEHDYRNGEAEFTDKSLEFENTVISTSADIILDSLNTETLQKESIFFLDGNPQLFFDRIKDRENIPIFYFHEGDENSRREKFVTNYKSRWDLYDDAASLRIDTDGLSPEQIADIIFKEIQG